jgi:hypothetical protein
MRLLFHPYRDDVCSFFGLFLSVGRPFRDFALLHTPFVMDRDVLLPRRGLAKLVAEE